MENNFCGLTKVCARCERELPLESFGRSKKGRDGLRATCRDCGGVLGKNAKDAYKEEIYNKLGHACVRCGFADKRALQIDHVFGGGNQEHKEISSNIAFLKKVISDTTGSYQILCANCNWIKRMEKLEHNRAKPFTPEEIEKILESRVGKPISERTRQKISEASKGRPAWNIGIPAWNLGIPRTEEEKEKISEKATAGWAKKTPEEKSRQARERDANMTPEQRSARAQKGADTLKAQREAEGWTPKPKVYKDTKRVGGEEVPYKWTLEERIEFSSEAKRRHSARTPEQKAATTAKTKATWAAKKAAAQQSR
jgi:RNase P subunit RPR2